MKTRFWVVASGLVWVLVVIVGLRAMLTYESTPGKTASAPVQWPAESRIQRAPDRATLVMAVHPQCPCTRATIGELNALMAQTAGKLAVHVLFYKPRGFAAGWEKTDLWRSAAAIPGVRVLSDEEGREARKFRASTSGQTLLFDEAGHLLFSGGITAGRGHSGDNAGHDAIVSFVTTGQAEYKETATFGCALGLSSF